MNIFIPLSKLGLRSALTFERKVQVFNPKSCVARHSKASAALDTYQFFIQISGSWFAAAYLEPTNEPQGFLRQQCRYSLGSIALWNRADNVELIQPNKQESFITSRHFSYFKFYVPQDTNHFTLTVANCSVLLKTGRALANNESCVQYIGMRAKALPLHQPTEFDQVFFFCYFFKGF